MTIFKFLLAPILSIVTITLCLAGSPGDNVKITQKEFDDRIEFYAVNHNPIPVSIRFKFVMRGLKEAQTEREYQVIHPNTSEKVVAVLSKTGQAWTYKYNMQVYLGDFYSGGHNQDHIYQLPFEKGQSFLLSQGYDGSFSHHKINAIDFTMPEGTTINALRNGIVAEVIEHNDRGCASRECLDLANSILIYHEDGSFARYAHLQKNGALIEIGEIVKAGQAIGLSGNTGWSSQPHLHFAIFEIREGNLMYSLPTLFQTETGVTYLEEGKYYKCP
ncbi:MAG: M23 family metallopeptidase [Bacteroidia bacterium]|nr:M23 family metallopeptidase [Bacteroidia bacterium]